MQAPRLLTLTVGIWSLVGCATPAARITDELVHYGLSQKQAACVGDHLQSRLSVAQLGQLASAARAFAGNDANPRQLTADDLARVSAEIRDPQIAIDVAMAGATCGVLASLLPV